jgi:hypothetical protein
MTEENNLNIKKRAAGLVAAASLVTGLFAVGAPAAHATTVEQCGGFFFFGTLTPPLAADGSNNPTVAAAKSGKAGTVVWAPGFASSFALPGVVGGPSTGTCGGAFINDSTMTVGTKLSGVASCVPTNTTGAYPLNGKIALANVAKTVKEQAYIRVAGFDTTAGPDIISLTGTDVKGLMPGASVSGEVGFDPVIKALVNNQDGGPELKNQYYFDNSQIAAACGTAGSNPIGLIFGTDTTTLLGSSGQPISFDL